MKLLSFISLISVFCLIFAITLVIPIAVAIYYHEPYNNFIYLFNCITIFAIPGYFIGKSKHQELSRIDGFITITATWLLLCLIAAIPFHQMLNASATDCIFEAISGLTTTGAEVFSSLDTWPQSLKIYHQFLQFLGGLGIIVLGIAIMPLLGHNANNLIETEQNVEQRLTPRIHKTAKQLWKLYIFMILLSVVSYHFAGLPWFDAWAYGFTTFSTGGFGIYSDSLMHYQSKIIYLVACLFAILGSLNFAIVFNSIRQRQISLIIKFPETKCLLKYLIILSSIVLIIMHKNKFNIDIIACYSSTVMMLTTTGLQITNFSLWPSFLSHLMLLSAIIGGSSGSTTGGIKMSRILLIHSEMNAMFKQILHPRAVKPNFKQQNSNLIHGFLAINLIVYLIAIMLMIDFGYSLDAAFAGVTACLTNVGISIDQLAHGYHNMTDSAKWLFSALMLLGRLEATTIIVLITPYFWREI